MAYSVQVTFDAHDPEGLARFWMEALGYVVPPPPGGFSTWDEALDAWGVPADERDRGFAIVDPDGAGPRLYFQKVPEPKTAKNRVHLDLRPTDRTREEEVERVLALGATQVADRRTPDGGGWVVLADPEGNEFCILRSDAELAAAAAR